MKQVINYLGPYSKALVLVAALVVAVAAESAGVDVGLDKENIVQALGAAVLVFLAPANKARLGREL